MGVDTAQKPQKAVDDPVTFSAKIPTSITSWYLAVSCQLPEDGLALLPFPQPFSVCIEYGGKTCPLPPYSHSSLAFPYSMMANEWARRRYVEACVPSQV